MPKRKNPAAATSLASTADLLKSLKAVSEMDILAGANKMVHDTIPPMVTPPDYLINPREVDYIDGYEVDLTALWDAIVRGENIYIVGPSGTGKSTTAFHLIDLANMGTIKKNREIFAENTSRFEKHGEKAELLPYHPLPYPWTFLECSPNTRYETLIGTMDVMLDETSGLRKPITIFGVLVDAWIKGKILIIDEMDFASPDVWSETHQFFDRRTVETMIHINGPMTIQKNNRFRVIGTGNTFGNAENQLEFAGTQLLNTAFLNRFTYKVELSWLKPDKEIDLISRRVPTVRQDAIAKLVEAAGRIREAKVGGALTRTITTRDLLSIARECSACQKRKNVGTATSLSNYWLSVMIPSCGPTFLTGNPDKDVITTYLELR